MKRTRIGPWRAGVLVAVHVLMVIHVIQWLLVGTTLSPVEPSESMQTLENGIVNAGAIFFGLALIVTIVFGRYVCGWLCHVIALQDFCAWLMGKAGIRPKPFRSRLLVFVPLVLGSYMFLWPNFKRLILQPAMDAANIDWPWWLKRVEPFYGFRNELFVEDYWATFPEWYIAIPFILVCGFATVYFLGSKAFCTYACPYGGMFGLVEPVAPVRVRVDHDKCKECGHCTAACTSNVRVHEEIKIYGMVVSPGCMKTMDCISVCPNEALSIAPGRPAMGARPRAGVDAERAAVTAKRSRRYDLSPAGEIAAALVFFVLFIATRGMLDQVPMLMAGGLAAVGTGLSVVLWKMLTTPNARSHRLDLRVKGRLRPAGIAFALLMLAGWAFAAWGGVGNFARWRGDALHAGVGIPVDAILRPEFAPSPEPAARARAALAWYARADAPGRGGLGWRLSPDDDVRVAYLHAVLGEFGPAVDVLRRVVERGNPTDGLIFQMLNLHARDASRQFEKDSSPENVERLNNESLQIMRDAIAQHPELHAVRLRLSRTLWDASLHDPSIWADPPVAEATDPRFLLSKGQVLALEGDRDGMGRILDRVLELDPHDPAIRLEAAQLANAIGRPADSIRLVESVVAEKPDAATLLGAARILAAGGRDADAAAIVERAASATGASQPATMFEIGRVFLALGQTDRGLALLREAASGQRHDPWQRLGFATALAQIGLELGLEPPLTEGIAELRALVERHPEEPIFRHDLAGMLFAINDQSGAIDQIVEAARLAPTNALLAERASQLLGASGRAEEAATWRAEAAARRAAP